MPKTERILQQRYLLQQQLSHNPTRQTWLAEDRKNKQQVILKILPFSPQTQWEELKLFEREAKVLQQLTHTQIPKYIDYFSLDDMGEGLPGFVLVQTYIPGSSLQQLLDSGKKFSEAKAKEIATQLLNILIYLHQLSPPVLHRDIKPSNIMKGKDGKIYLVDFGAVQDKAKAEGVTFTVVGTGGYSPPEQLWGQAIPASDLYALGATLIHLLTGTPPAKLPQRRMRLYFREHVSLNPDFTDWLERLTNPSSEQRFTSANQALFALQGIENKNQKINQKSNLGALFGSTLLQYGAVFLAVIALPAFVYVRRGCCSEAKINVGAMNRGQQAHFLEQQSFAYSIEELDIGIQLETENYKYSMENYGVVAAHYGISKQENFKSYVGLVTLTDGDETTNELLTLGIVCETEEPSVDISHPPFIIEDGIFNCPPGTKNLEEEGIEVGEEFELVYRVFNLLEQGENEKAAQIAQNLTPNSYKELYQDRVLQQEIYVLSSNKQYDKALALIANFKNYVLKVLELSKLFPYLKTEKQYDEVLSLLSTIQNHWSLLEGLEAVAPYLKTVEQYDKFLSLLSTIQSDWQKSEGLEAVAPHLKTTQQYDKFLSLITTLTNDWQKSEGLVVVAPHLKTTQQYDKFLSLILTFNDEFKLKILEAVLPHLETTQQYDKALQISETIQDKEYKKKVVKAIESAQKNREFQ